MARIGNFDVHLNYQGLFDKDLADPINGFLDKTAIGLSDINLYPPGIPSATGTASGVATGQVIKLINPPGIPPATGTSGNDGVAPAKIAILVEPPGIWSASLVPPDEIAIIIEAPGIGIPSVSVVEPAVVTESPPTPPVTRAHGGWPTQWPPPLPEKPVWWADAWGKWLQDNPHNDWVAGADGSGEGGKPPPPPDDGHVIAFPLDSNDDNGYVLPLKSFESVPEPNSRVLEYMRFRPRPEPLSLDRAAGFDVVTQPGSGSSVHPIVWVAVGAFAAFAVMKMGARFAEIDRKLGEVIELQSRSSRSATRSRAGKTSRKKRVTR